MSEHASADEAALDWSIVVPTYRRPAPLAACLAALAALDYPPARFEVIVVDDGSGAPPADLVATYADRLIIALLTPPHRGPAAARNAGLARARGAHVAFTDDDCKPQPGWLQALNDAAEQTPDQALGGHTINALPANLWSTASQVLVDYLYAYFNTASGPAGFFTSNNLAVPAAALRELGGFDTSFPLAAGEDRELCDRWLASGRRLRFVPDAVVAHAHHLTARRFWRQHVAYGRGAWHFHQTRARRGAGRVRLEPVRFYRDLLRAPFGMVPRRRAPLLAAALVVAQVANLVGFLRERGAQRRGRRWLATGPSPQRPRR